MAISDELSLFSWPQLPSSSTMENFNPLTHFFFSVSKNLLFIVNIQQYLTKKKKKKKEIVI